ncbi:MAG: DUF2752 domain-containing protein [Puniceicoccales bacterium]|nr:DUF2752 domain-containing protein [Puniceicoccales bacterium]
MRDQAIDVKPPPLPGATQATWKRECWAPRTLALLVLAGIAVGFAWALYAGPKPPAWYPRCIVYWLTGLYCPGCGTGRAVHAVAHGLFAEAVGRNLLLACMAPLLFIWSAVTFWRALAHNQLPLALPVGMARIVLIVVLLFTVARNLPWWPFCLLAP